ncbi:MAG: tetratricopeptide repeat protein, partial [Limisphaerales bacterium]
MSSKNAFDQARSLILQALDLITEGTLETADLCLQKASKLAPNKPDLQFALGLFHEESGDVDQAQHHYEQAVQLDSCHAQAQINLGLLHGQNQALGQAESCFQNAIAAEPHLPEAHLNLGNILQQTNRLPEAEAAYRCALRVEPTLATGHRNLSSILLWQNRHAEALQHALKAAQHDPVDGETHNALGAIFKATQQIEKAEACFRLALETDRENPAYHTNLAGALVDAGKLNQAQYHYQQAIQLNAMLPDAHHGLGMLQLQTGNLEAGWKNYEWRWQTAQQNKRRHQGKPEWNGESTPDKTLFVYCEQGLGDSIQFVRFLIQAAERVDSIILECPPETADLFRTIRVESLTIITADRTPPPFDFQIALLSLPKALGATLENIPKGVPYLRPSSQASPIDTQLSSQKLNVGLVWAGNPQHRNDAFRSMQWTDCERLLETDFAHFVSLQLNASDKVNAAIAKSPNAIDATAHC